MGYDMTEYLPPSSELAKAGVEAHFLGQYSSGTRTATPVAKEPACGKACRARRTGGRHENLDNAQTGLHDHAMYRKYGYGRGCAQISVDIRAGRVTRQHAMAWVAENDGRFPTSTQACRWRTSCNALGAIVSGFPRRLDAHTNWSLFDPPGSASPRGLREPREPSDPRDALPRARRS
jgi:hypothetical protein